MPNQEKTHSTLGRCRSWLTAAGVAAVWGIALCAPATAETPDPNRILVKDFMFMPNSLTVKAGSTVTWANIDDEPHTVVSQTGLFRSGPLDPNKSSSFTFDTP